MASTLTLRGAEVSIRRSSPGAADYVTKPSSTRELALPTFKRELVSKVKALAVSARRAGSRSRPGLRNERFRAATPSASGRWTRRPWCCAHAAITPAGHHRDRQLDRRAAGAVRSAVASEGRHPPADPDHPAHAGDLHHDPGRAHHPLSAACRAPRPRTASHWSAAASIWLPATSTWCWRPAGASKVLSVNKEPPENFCRPAVDPMMRSIAQVYGKRAARHHPDRHGAGRHARLHRTGGDAGGTVVAQDEPTSVVWGMPGAVATAGLCSAVLPLREIGPFIRKIALRTAA